VPAAPPAFRLIHLTPRRSLAVLLAVPVMAAAAGLAGCGGGQERAAAPSAPPATTTAPAPRGLDPSVLPPARIPTQATKAADPAARKVIEAWLTALRHGRLTAAARLFAVPSVFQNGTPVLHLDSAAETLAVVRSFPCGAIATHFAGAGSYTLVRFRLTERTGGDCHGATGATTGGAIRVSGGRIREWYRLYDPEEIVPGAPAPGEGGQKA
jgi:limonene-1,2-epoxide hydrolase